MATQARSLQARLMVLVVGLVMAVWLLAAAITWFDVRRELDELLDSHLAQAAAVLVIRQAPDSELDGRGIDAPLLHRYARKVVFQVFHKGQLVQRSVNAPALPMLAPGQQFKPGFATVQIDKLAWRVFAAYGAESDVQVFVGERVGSRTAIVRAVVRIMLWPLLVALPLLALAAWWAVRRGVAPLRRLGNTLAQRQPQSLHALALDDATSEMEPLLNALNGLFERIAALMESERRFTADAAHELRTPIAAIRAQAQVALGADGGNGNGNGRRAALQATLEGCDRATRLVEQLLTLSRLEAGTAPVLAQLDLGELARTVVAELAPLALQKQQDIALDAAERCAVRGDATLLCVLVRNLVDNAVRYCPPGGTVLVRVALRNDGVALSVADSGPGMAEPDMQRLGERFFRVVGNGQSGSGLGWSIVRRIAAVHAAQVRVSRSKDLAGLAVEVLWPHP